MKRLLYILLFFTSFSLNAQDVPIFSQYVNNGIILSPAYTGSREVLSMNLMYRNQWVGLKGAPVYQTFSAHAPLKGAKVGVGLLVFDQKFGASHNTQAFLNYAYRVSLGKGKLSFGIRAGMIMQSNNWGNISTYDKDDKVFQSNNDSYVLPNLGVGIYYYSNRMFLGLSVPYMLSVKPNSTYNGYSVYHNMSNYNYLLTGGILLDFSAGFKLKPTALLKYNPNLKQQFDLNLNVILLNNRLWLCGAYRIDEAYNGTIEVQLNPQLRLGYSFDYGSGKILNLINNSHEISLRYEFSYKIKAVNPRYF
jgi:type IX secretion system PorP/SprF family membrane protein